MNGRGCLMRLRYKILITLMVLIFIVSFSLKISYSLITKPETKENATYVETNDTLSINYFNGNNFSVPSFKNDDVISKKISITNVSETPTYITISLMDIAKDFDNLTITLTNKDNQKLYDEPLNSLDIDILKTELLNSKETKTFTITLQYHGLNPTSSFSANIMIHKENVKKEVKSFKDIILSSNSISTSTTLNNAIASTAEGLLQTDDDLGKTFYFRGSIENNYVNFGGYSWRIVRINGDGSVRLILDGILDNTMPYNNQSAADDAINKTNYDKISLKEELTSYLNNNLNDITKYIVNSQFCSESSILDSSNSIAYFPAYNRVMVDNNPTLKCLGTINNSKIGLISADEVTFAGAYHNSPNQNYYLYNSNIINSWWTLSASQVLSSSNTIDVFSISSTGALISTNKITTSLAVRPVISLDKNVSVTGTGTINDPYKIN